MTNLTLTIDAEVLKRARIRAIEEDTSVNAVVREFMERYAGEQKRKREDAIRDLLRMSNESRASNGGKKFDREALYEERMR